MSLRNRTQFLMATALALTCAAAHASPARAQENQVVVDAPSVRIDKLALRIHGVRYENINSNRPSVVIYVAVQNATSVSTVLMAANLFDESVLLHGSGNYGAKGYTFAAGTAPGQEGTFTAGKVLKPGQNTTLVFRYQLEGPVPTAPLTWIVRERPSIVKLLKEISQEHRLSVPGYVPPMPTPPTVPLAPTGIQTLRMPASFIQPGGFRLRTDQITYGRGSTDNGRGSGLTVINMTLQNTTNAPLDVNPNLLNSFVVEQDGRRSQSPGVSLDKGNGASVTLAPREWLSGHFTYYLENQAAQRAARRVEFKYGSGQTLTIDLPPFTAGAVSGQQVAAKAAPEIPATAAVTTGDFQKTAYMDVKLDRAGRSKLGGAEVTLTLRNMIGRRLGMQNDWQTYSLLASDGVEYRADGNHYGTSGSDTLASTVWLENENEAKRTWVFLKVPPTVTPVRLIVREYGKEKASIELPR
ncbi:MAG: hypothetical protein MT490_10755 [Sphingomonas sp.]|uniref:hypothetical protein n=1 Tax=Sphingomonas sp. TaxID=28214 RepID=UPI002274BE5B|nr:hypothetical protein [Sphingomonas sp.]MCX8476263.1 hypothetical protein [Sphingomonas sp.]